MRTRVARLQRRGQRFDLRPQLYDMLLQLRRKRLVRIRVHPT
jgi:hypothetical protein